MGKWTDAAKVKAAAIAVVGGMLTDEQAFTVPALFLPWAQDADYAAGDRRTYGGQLYRCLQAHTAQTTWVPDAAPSLWVRIDDPSEAWPVWIQPAGATDAYALGAKVSHDGKHWTSTAADNVWEPGVYGWVEVE